jgi:hypothetical protein
MHARSCGETRGRNRNIETAWMQEVAERLRCVRALEYWSKMLARNQCNEWVSEWLNDWVTEPDLLWTSSWPNHLFTGEEAITINYLFSWPLHWVTVSRNYFWATSCGFDFEHGHPTPEDTTFLIHSMENCVAWLGQNTCISWILMDETFGKFHCLTQIQKGRDDNSDLGSSCAVQLEHQCI